MTFRALSGIPAVLLFCAIAAFGADRGALSRQRAGPQKVDTIPTWLDTTAPVVSVQPKEIYHNSIFHVTFKATKQATIWYSVVTPSSPFKKAQTMEIYREPFTVLEEGTTRIYFQGEDLLGNKSRLDSIFYVFDTRQPVVTVRPDPGRYRSRIMLHFEADKPCRFFWVQSLIDTAGSPMPESLAVKDSLSGYVAAVDRAGNKTMTRRLNWIVDSTTIRVDIKPKEGIYNTPHMEVSFTAFPKSDIFYSFDPSAPPSIFSKVDKPVPLPYGNTIVRYYAKNSIGWESDIMRATYFIDTIPPKLLFSQKSGSEFDTLALSTKKPSVIRYTLDASFPTESSALYGMPLIVPRKGKCDLKAVARDPAGNRSELFEWNYKYDKTPPVISLSSSSGTYGAPFNLTVRTSKPAQVLYSLDGTPVSEHSILYKNGIPISKEGSTVLRIIAVDEAGNASPEVVEEYIIDSKPPIVKARVEEDVRQNAFFITLSANEPADIRYEIGGAAPSLSSPLYSGKIAMRLGQILRYYAIDKAGNRSEVRVMDDLSKPIVSVFPEGGVHNKPVKIVFHANEQTQVFWRLAPDTVYNAFKDSLVLAKEGSFTLEYYSEGQNGLTSPTRRAEYVVDLTPPQTDVIVKKGNRDSVSVFFECNKNATIYYTLDGSNPAYSATTRSAGNKFLLAADRISIKRTGDVKLAFYAEDAAGNQSPIRVLDVFKPRAVPDVPSGRDRVYDRVLSVNLNTYDSKSVVYFARHGHTPTADSAVFSQPLTLVASDTILAFVVDAAGYRGQIDTFVYLIDLPPTPDFSVAPGEIKQGASVTFDASGTIDYETVLRKLSFRWNFDAQNAVFTPWSHETVVTHAFSIAGRHAVALEVMDEAGRTSTKKRDVFVGEICPRGMVARARSDGSAFCIDNYEWPNIAGEKPQTNVSWVQAKIYCMDAGKRLCSASEWTDACQGEGKSGYPYGVKYEKGKCPTEGKGISRSGRFPQCGGAGNAQDMVGNVWEWIEDKRGDYPVMMGGTFKFGSAADCNLSSEGGVGLKSNEVGFRCCK